MKTVKAWAIVNGAHIRSFFGRDLLYISPTKKAARKWLDLKSFSIVRVEIRELKRKAK